MYPTEKINFIISGVREGFKKSHILCNNNIAEVIDYIDDRRQITNTATDFFYTIEKTTNYTLLSIFNPNTTDQVGRRAYIAITLFVSNGYLIKGNILDALNNLMNYYEQKQANELTNRFTEEMFEAQYAQLNIEKSTFTESAIRNKQGYIIYDQVAEIIPHLESPAINGFQKVYLLSTKNINVASHLISFEKITEFPKAVVYKIADFENGIYEVFINNLPYHTAGKFDIQYLHVTALQGDVITITHKASKKLHKFVAAHSGQTIQLHDCFPKSSSVNLIRPETIGGTNLHSGSISPKPASKKLNKALLIMIGVLVPVVIGLVYNSVVEPPKPPVVIISPHVEVPIKDANQATSTAEVITPITANSSNTSANSRNVPKNNSIGVVTQQGANTNGNHNIGRSARQTTRDTGSSSSAVSGTDNTAKGKTEGKISKGGNTKSYTNCSECKKLKAEIDGESDVTLKRSIQQKLKNHEDKNHRN